MENVSETPSNCRTGDQSPIDVTQSHIDTLQDDHLSDTTIVDQPESDIPIDVQSAFGNTTDIDEEQKDSYSVATQIDVPNAPPRPENIIDERENTIDFSVPNIRYHQSCDELFGPIIRYLQNGELPEEQRAQRKILVLSSDYFIYDSMLFYLRKPKSKRVMNMECAQLALPSVIGEFCSETLS